MMENSKWGDPHIRDRDSRNYILHHGPKNQLNGTKTHQNEVFWVKSSSTLHHGWRKFSIQEN